MALIRCSGGDLNFSKFASAMGGSNTGYIIVTYENGSGIAIQSGDGSTSPMSNSDILTAYYDGTNRNHIVNFKMNCHVIYGYGNTTFEGDKAANDTLSIPAQSTGYTLFAYVN